MALEQPAAAVFTEAISNPLLTIPDLDQLAILSRSAGARLIVDNTLATPYLCHPLAHGADVVVHSGSKYLGGHSDTLCGVIAADREFIHAARDRMVTFGSPAAPFDSWLTARGLRTLDLRMARACDNAEQVAAFLAGCEVAVAEVIYPGLGSHPQHARARSLFEHSFGAIISFELFGGAASAATFVRGLRQTPLAPSFGDVGTTIACPAAMLEGEDEAAISSGLLRLSVGIEQVDEIIEDMARGLVKVANA